MEKAKKIRALIADDEPHIRMFLRTILESMGIEIAAEAVNGSEAVELYAKEKPLMTFLDINMPVKTGDETLKEIIGLNPEALVIMLTSATDRETVEQFIDMGASNYIRKDTPVQELKKLIKETWDEYRKSRKR